MEDEDDRGLAPKVFFLNPDPTTVSEAFLETGFLLGYEVYALAGNGTVKDQVDVLVDTFDQLLLFFTVEAPDPESAAYFGALQDRYGERVRVGVLYSRTMTEQEEAETKRLYLLEAGLSGGCVGIHSSARRNQQLLLDVLAANQAGGRRKHIRMRCHAPYGVNFPAGENFRDAALVDLSVSHFSARFESDPDWDLGTRVSRVQLRLAGQLLLVNVLVGLKRQTHGQAVYVFLFHPESNRAGLHDLVSAKINWVIYRHHRGRTEALLEERLRAKV